MRRGNAGTAEALMAMDTPEHDRPPTPTPGGKSLPQAPRKTPGGWGRLGLASVLGLVAGTILFPTPAKGRDKGRDRAPPAG